WDGAHGRRCCSISLRRSGRRASRRAALERLAVDLGRQQSAPGRSGVARALGRDHSRRAAGQSIAAPQAGALVPRLITADDRRLDVSRQARLPCPSRLEAGAAGICGNAAAGSLSPYWVTLKGGGGGKCRASTTSAPARWGFGRASIMRRGSILPSLTSCF